MYLPTHTWHATYSETDPDSGEAVIGIGGMGDSTVAMGLAVTGNLDALTTLLQESPSALLQTNAHGELPTHRAGTVEVLSWLGETAKVPFKSTAAVAVTPFNEKKSLFLPLTFQSFDECCFASQ